MSISAEHKTLFCELFADEYQKQFVSTTQDGQPVPEATLTGTSAPPAPSATDSSGVSIALTWGDMAGEVILKSFGYASQQTAVTQTTNAIDNASAATFFSDLAERYRSAVQVGEEALSGDEAVIVNNLKRAGNYFSESADQLSSATDSLNVANNLFKAAENLGVIAGTLDMVWGAMSDGTDGLGESASGVLAGAGAAALVGAAGASITEYLAALGAGALTATLAPVVLAMAAGYLGAKVGEAMWDSGYTLGLGTLMEFAMDHGLGWTITKALGLRDSLSEVLANGIEHLAASIDSDSSYRIVRYDPLAIDLNGDGVIGTRDESDWNGTLFDNDGDGIRTATGWIGSDDGLLVRDLDGNGTIDSGRELFGESTILADGSTAENGFQALASLDQNADGVVDASDAAFASLRVWRDANGNGVTDAGELLSLAEIGITSFAVDSVASDTAVDGGKLVASGSYSKLDADGNVTTGVMQDFDLDNDSIHSQYSEQLVVPDAIASLADFKGIGKLRDLQQACVVSPALAQDLQDFCAATTRGEQHAILENLLLDWAKTSPTYAARPEYTLEGVILHASGATEDATSDNVVYLRPGETPSAAVVDLDQATVQKIRVVEAVIGADHVTDLWFGDDTLKQYLDIYDRFFGGVYDSLAGQTRLSGYVDAVGMSWSDSAGLVFDFSKVIAMLEQRFSENELTGTSDLIDLMNGVAIFSDNQTQLISTLSDFLDGIGHDGLSEGLKALYADQATADGSLKFAAANGSGDGAFTIGDTSADNTISGDTGGDILIGGAGNDTVSGNGGNDILLGGDGNDRLYAGTGNDLLDGGAGDDYLSGSNSGANHLIGGAGDDVLATGIDAHDNVLEGGTGNDILNGSHHSDTYLFNLGDGQDTITETYHSTGSVDTLKFGEGIVADDVSVLRTGDDLVLALANGTDQVTIKNWFATTWNKDVFVDKISFADGTVWTPSTLIYTNITLTGTDAGESLHGWNGRDNLVGGAGDDTLVGNGGNDILLGGDGNDRLYAGTGNDLLDGGDGDDYLSGSNSGANHLIGGAGDDVLATGIDAHDNVLEGGTGNDILNGSHHSDTYLFNLGDGQDTITETYHSTGSVDTLKFGEGIVADDVSVLRTGDDLVLALANGTDQVTIKNWFATTWNKDVFVDKISFADGTVWTPSTLIYTNITLTGTDAGESLHGWNGRDNLVGGAGDDTLVGNGGNDILLGGDGNDRLYAGTGNDLLDGGAGDDYLSGSNSGANHLIGGAGDDVLATGIDAHDNVLEGGTGNDILNGSHHSDTYLFNLGDGQDTITETYHSTGSVDTLKFGEGIVADDVSVLRTGDDLVLALANGTDQVTIKNWFATTWNKDVFVDKISFADGTVWTPSTLIYTNITLTGTDAGESLHGWNGRDNLVGGAGDDTLVGNGGNDILLGGDGNDRLYAGTGNDLLDGGDGDDYLSGSNSGANHLIGGAGDDVLATGIDAHDNVLEGGTGNDILNGSHHSDTYLFNLGDGQDTIIETYHSTGSVDTLKFGEGIAANDVSVLRTGDDLVLALANGTDQVTIKNWFATEWNSAVFVDRIQFADGTVWTPTTLKSREIAVQTSGPAQTVLGWNGMDRMIGGDGDDTFSGHDGNDTLLGGAGNDHLYGGMGNDLLDGGDGDDVLNGSGYGANHLIGGAGNDALATGDNAHDNVLEGGTGNDTLTGSRYSDTYLFNLGDGQDTIIETYHSTGSVDTLKFGEGIAANDVSVLRTGDDLVLALANGTDQVTIKNWFATEWNSAVFVDRIQFADGTVWTPTTLKSREIAVQTSGPAQTVLGWNGMDRMIGGDGDDTFSGHDGNDTLLGGAGNDHLYGGMGNDLLDGGDGDDVLNGSGYGANHLIGGAGNDALATGDNAHDNVLEGGTGNDILTGSRYSDTYLFNLGDGQDTIIETYSSNGSVDTLKFGEGIATDQLWFTRDGDNLDLQVIGTDDLVVIKDWYVNQNNHVEAFATADGHVLHDSQVDALVAAMSSFAPPAQGQTTLPPEYRDDLSTTLAASWS